MKFLYCLAVSSFLIASEVPQFMQSFVSNKSSPEEIIAQNNIYSLNDNMFTIYDKSLEIYKKNFLDRHPVILGLFSGQGGRFILYMPGKPPLEAEPVPSIYQVAKSVGHSAMATFTLLAPYTAAPSKDLAWLAPLTSYRTNIQTSIEALDSLKIKKEERQLLSDTLKQIAAFMDTCIKNRNFTYNELKTFCRTIKPNLAKLIDVATNAQVKHWWSVLEQWKKMIGDEWNNTYALSNSIYVARQNNILYSILVQFFGEQAMNDRLLLMETTDFTTTPELMLEGFIRIVSDRMIGEIFFNNPRLMDFELLGGSARKVIEAEAARRGLKPLLPPLVPFNSHSWPMETDPKTGAGSATMDEIE